MAEPTANITVTVHTGNVDCW